MSASGAKLRMLHPLMCACLQDSMSMELQSRSSVRDRYSDLCPLSPSCTVPYLQQCLHAVLRNCLGVEINGLTEELALCGNLLSLMPWVSAAHSSSASGIAARCAIVRTGRPQENQMTNTAAVHIQQAISSMGSLSWPFCIEVQRHSQDKYYINPFGSQQSSDTQSICYRMARQRCLCGLCNLRRRGFCTPLL